jgi:hypothetical protein
MEHSPGSTGCGGGPPATPRSPTLWPASLTWARRRPARSPAGGRRCAPRAATRPARTTCTGSPGSTHCASKPKRSCSPTRSCCHPKVMQERERAALLAGQRVVPPRSAPGPRHPGRCPGRARGARRGRGARRAGRQLAQAVPRLPRTSVSPRQLDTGATTPRYPGPSAWTAAGGSLYALTWADGAVAIPGLTSVLPCFGNDLVYLLWASDCPTRARQRRIRACGNRSRILNLPRMSWCELVHAQVNEFYGRQPGVAGSRVAGSHDAVGVAAGPLDGPG